MERIESDADAHRTVLIETGELRPITRSITGQIVEFGKDVTLLTQLLVGLDGSEEMGMLVLDSAFTAVEKRRRQTEPVGKIEHWGQFQRDEVVVVGGCVSI